MSIAGRHLLVLAGALSACATSGRTLSHDEFSQLACPETAHHIQEGLVESCMSSAGVLQGRTIEWEQPGIKKSEGEFKDGKRSGRWVLWYRNGVKAWERTYAEGQLLSEATFYEDGRPFTPHRTPGALEEGAFPRDIIHRVIETQAEAIQQCYTDALAATPGLLGSIAVRFTIGPHGEVDYPDLASSTMENSRLEECIIRLIAHLEFPRPPPGGVVRVKYPFVFPATAG